MGDKKDQMRECCSKEACEFKHVCSADDIIPHLLNLYGSRATPNDFKIYAEDASFEDPLMCAHGVKQIKSAFYSIAKIFSESSITEYTVKENIISPGKLEPALLIRLYVENGKVIRHEDWWDKKPLWNRETTKLSLVGRAMEMTRRGSMLATHAMMGFGKDPTK